MMLDIVKDPWHTFVAFLYLDALRPHHPDIATFSIPDHTVASSSFVSTVHTIFGEWYGVQLRPKGRHVQTYLASKPDIKISLR
jgi:hypothetical protein